MNELTRWKVGQAKEQDDGSELVHCCQIAAMKRMILAQPSTGNKGKQVSTDVHLSALPVQWWLEAFNKPPVSFVIIRPTGGSYQKPEKWKALSFWVCQRLLIFPVSRTISDAKWRTHAAGQMNFFKYQVSY